MRNLVWLGVVLIILGIAGLAFANFSYTETKPVLKAGPVEVNAKEEHHVTIPTVAGGRVYVGAKRWVNVYGLTQ